MKKKELLAPVGNKESLYQAIHNGADAVYLAGKNYGARSYADNFTEEELIDAIKTCHLYGVKIYVTVNTIVFDDEKNDFIKYIEFLYKNNVDAVIMQDIGMISLVRTLYPDLEIHASTQMHNYNSEGIKVLERLGVKRVVFAREMSLDEIKKIDTSLEKEVFVHGALCVCYSGCCLFSAMKSNRSGNRGECIASCRLKYKLLKNGKYVSTDGNYLLSTKELNTIDKLDELIDTDVFSFKIEGRMKSPEYVGFITRLYREKIDSNIKTNIDDATLTKMKSLFNREYTNGYLFGEFGRKLMNIKSPNHLGSPLGEIIYLDKYKIKIKLFEDLNQEDALRFVSENKGMIVNKLYNEKDLLVNRVEKGRIAVVDNKVGLKEKGLVNKTIDKLLLDDIRMVNEKRIPIFIKVDAKLDDKLKLTIWDSDGNVVSEYGENVSGSINRPVSESDIEKQINRLGNTPFVCSKIEIDSDDDIFIPNKELNSIRRNCVEKLITLRENIKPGLKNKRLILNEVNVEKEKNNLNVLANNLEQLKACIDMNVDNIYLTDYELYKEYKGSNIYYVLPRIMKSYPEYKNENLLVRELGSLKYSDSNNIVSDYTLNASNSDSVKLISSFGVDRVCYSVEVKNHSLQKSSYNTEMLVYGRVELMIMKYCPINMLINSDNNKCGLCKKNDNYSLEDELGNVYPLRHNNCVTTIYDSNNINLINKIDEIKNKVNNIRINLFDEDYNKTVELIRLFRG